MADQFHKAGWTSHGFMSFTVANGAVLELGGATATVPTAHLSGGISGATGFLAAGIPHKLDKSAFADIARPTDGNGHAIKHAIITLVSAGATAPAARRMADGSTPTTSLGAQWLVGDNWTIENNPEAIFHLKAFNRSGGNAVFEVEVFE